MQLLTEPGRQGKTWRLAPAESGDKPDLLVVDIDLAAALCDDETLDALAQWEELGRKLQAQLDGEAGDAAPLDAVTLLVLRTVDPANRKAIYQRRLGAREIYGAWEIWKAACANTPGWLSLPTPVKGERALQHRRPPQTLAPLSLTPVSSSLFAGGGRRRVPVAGVGPAEAFALFLGDGDRRARARRILRLLVQRHGALLAAVAMAHGAGVEALKTFDPGADLRPAALRSAAWIGALLHRLDRDTETIMSDVAFRLGQLLAIVDRIHVGYCADLRGGATPPVLIGAAVFGMAGEDPARALGVLQPRMKPYLAWLGGGSLERIRRRAEVFEKTDGASGKQRAIAMRVAQSLSHRARPLFEALSGEVSAYAKGERRTDDVFRAELLLGYLAGPPPAPKKDAAAATGADTELENGGEQE